MPAARITGGLHRATEDCVRRAHLQATTNYSTRPGQAPENRSYLARMSHSGGGSKPDPTDDDGEDDDDDDGRS